MNRIVNFINKHLTHPRDTDKDFGIRVILHIPIGMVMAWLCLENAWAGIGLVLIFLVYEWTEDWRTNDHAWKDLFGALVGFTVIALLGSIIGI